MANLYNLKRFDLNLLIIFECIYQNLSISQAAQTLFITPSAVSQSLQRLRVQLDDPLFVRSGKGITPTNVAINLHQHLAGNLDSLEQTINMMEHSALNKRFVVYGPQMYANNKIMDLMNLLFAIPNLEVEYHDNTATTESVEDLMHYRKADIIITAQPVNNRALVCQPLLDIPTTIICRKDHPRIDTHATMDALKKERFTLLQTRINNIKDFQTQYSEQFSLEHTVAFKTSSLISVFNTIRHSDLLGIVPQKSFEMIADAYSLKEISTPLNLPMVRLYMVYSRASLASQSFMEIINNIELFN